MKSQHDLQPRLFRPDSSKTRRNDDRARERETLNFPNYLHDEQTKTLEPRRVKEKKEKKGNAKP